MSHQPIQFNRSDTPPRSAGVGGGDLPSGESTPTPADLAARPVSLDLKKEVALTIVWNDGRTSVYPVAYLRRLSPSAEARQLREEMARNPLTVLSSRGPAGAGDGPATPFAATHAELVGHYALKIEFSDGHRTGIYSWTYLREIDPDRKPHPVNPDATVKP